LHSTQTILVPLDGSDNSFRALNLAISLAKKLEEKLDLETSKLIQNLGTKSKNDLQEILLQHIRAKQEMTKFSGAQAMDQSKIEMFHVFLTKYISAIESRLNQ